MRHAYGHAHIHSDGDCDGNGHIHADSDCHGNSYAYTDSYANGHGNCDRTAASYTDAATSADTAAACEQLLCK